MPKLDQDKRFLEAGVQVLSDYLLSKELFYPLDGDLPRLTIGNLMLAHRRLAAAGYDTLSNEIITIRAKWRVAWGQKASREIHTRLELWQNFLGDYRASPENNADRYPVEVRHRVILQLLAEDAESTPELDLLPGLDSKLKGSLLPGEFVWEKQVAVGFDRNGYWYLFGSIKSK
jgi:hypothetical protein